MTDQVTITGATGLVGTALRQELTARGVPFRVLVRSPDRAAAVTGAAGVVVGSITDPDALTRACRGSGAVVHLMRSSHDIGDLGRWDYPAMPAVLGAVNAEHAELHFTSTQAVFGDATDPPPLLTDDDRPDPAGAYGAMKMAWERTARALCVVPPVVYRMPVVVPERIADGAGWVRELFGDGFCRVDRATRTVVLRPRDARFARTGFGFAHVEDVAATIAGNLGRAAAHGTVAMLADRTYIRFRDLATAYAGIARAHGFAVHDEWGDSGQDGEVAGAMYRFESAAAERLGFPCRGGEPRLMEKATRWFEEALDRRTERS